MMTVEFKDTFNTQRILLIVTCVLLSTSTSEQCLGASPVAKIDWCSSRFSCQGKPNVMCKYPNKISGLNCRNLKNTIDFMKRGTILNMHNRVRAKFATGEIEGFPTASNMRILRWDFELETVALRWAIQCLNSTDFCRRTPRHYEVGQNVAVRTYKKFHGNFKGRYKGKWFSTTTRHPEMERDDGNVPDMEIELRKKTNTGGPADPMQDWVQYQLPYADPKHIKSFNDDTKTGKLFQVIWAETDRLGCSQVTFLNPQDFVTVSWVCNYAPAGNREGSSVYEPGKTCSRCPRGADCLCGMGKPLRSRSQSIQESLGRATIFRVTASFMCHHLFYSIIINYNLTGKM